MGSFFYEANARYIENGELKRLSTCNSINPVSTVEEAEKRISMWRDFYHFNIIRAWIDVRYDWKIIDTIEV